MKDFRLIKIIAYIICIVLIVLWSVVNVLSYNVAMGISSIIFSCTLFIEAKEAHDTHHKNLMYRHIGFGILFIVGVIFVFILKL